MTLGFSGYALREKQRLSGTPSEVKFGPLNNDSIKTIGSVSDLPAELKSSRCAQFFSSQSTTYIVNLDVKVELLASWVPPDCCVIDLGKVVVQPQVFRVFAGGRGEDPNDRVDMAALKKWFAEANFKLSEAVRTEILENWDGPLKAYVDPYDKVERVFPICRQAAKTECEDPKSDFRTAIERDVVAAVRKTACDLLDIPFTTCKSFYEKLPLGTDCNNQLSALAGVSNIYLSGSAHEKLQPMMRDLCRIGWTFKIAEAVNSGFDLAKCPFDSDASLLYEAGQLRGILGTGSFKIDLRARQISIHPFKYRGSGYDGNRTVADACNSMYDVYIDLGLLLRDAPLAEPAMKAIDGADYPPCVALATLLILTRGDVGIYVPPWMFCNSWHSANGLTQLQDWSDLAQSTCNKYAETSCLVLPAVTAEQLSTLLKSTKSASHYDHKRPDDVLIFFGHGGVDDSGKFPKAEDEDDLRKHEMGLMMSDKTYLSGAALDEAASQCTGKVILFACKAWRFRDKFKNASLFMAPGGIDLDTFGDGDGDVGGCISDSHTVIALKKALDSLREERESMTWGTFISNLRDNMDIEAKKALAESYGGADKEMETRMGVRWGAGGERGKRVLV